MSLEISCNACDYSGRVSPAKAGKTISCPGCDEPIDVPRGKAAKVQRRPKSDTNSVAKIALVGSVVLLAGVLGLFWLKLQQDDNFRDAFDERMASDNGQTQAPDVSQDPGGVAIPDASEDQAQQAGASANQKTPSQSDGAGTLAANTDGGGENMKLPEINAVPPEWLLLSGLKEVQLQFSGFPEDARLTVQEAVKTEIQSALQKCQLVCNEDTSKPRMKISLDLRQAGDIKRLGMAAILEADLGGLPVKLWEADRSMVPLDNKALKTGILPPGLDREVSEFFVSLRNEITTARTKISAIRKNQEMKARQQTEG